MVDRDPDVPGRDVAACRKLFADFGRQTAKGTPLYSSLARGIADDDHLAGLLRRAPPSQQLPVLLFASVHWLLLSEPDTPLARYYPNLAGDDVLAGNPLPAFRSFCREREGVLVELLATRRTQTNEIGRTSLLLPVFGVLETEVGGLAHVDVGASAGLNLLLPHYDFVYEPGGSVERGSTVRLACGTRGRVPIPPAHPGVAVAVGLDSSPIDVADSNQARWLEACVWPDQVERFDRLRSAIAIARDVGVDVRTGDALDAADLVSDVAGADHPVLTTSWVLNYLSPDHRRQFVAAIERLAQDRDCSWVYAESPALCPELPGIPPRHGSDQPTAVVLVRWRSGRRTSQHVADAHPHGTWMHWHVR